MTNTLTTLELATQLINIDSVTPNDNGCQQRIREILEPLGFSITELSSNGVTNIFARKGTEGPLLAFSGHTDVVPPGATNRWKSDPFTATERDGYLFGRGAADMKGALAAMVMSVKHFVENHPNHIGSIAFMITSDEEGDATDGTLKIVEYIEENNIHLDWCVIGEASSNEALGDSIKIGRRGSLHGALKVIGKQGHVAYPQLADNPIHRSFKALDALTQIQWDEGDEHFTPTSLQIYNINADTGASNIIPGSLNTRFNFRFSPASSVDSLKDRVHKVFDDHDLQYDIDWKLMSHPFFCKPGKLVDACKTAIKQHCNRETHPNTTGGTSDGRYIARTGCEIVELGAVNSCIHQVNEHIKIEDLEHLTNLYETICEELLTKKPPHHQ